MQTNKAKIIATALIIALVLVGIVGAQVTVALGTKGLVTLGGVAKTKSVCGDPSQGLLYVVGNQSNTGVIYKVNSLDSTRTGYAQQVNSTSSTVYVACKVGPDNKLWVAGVLPSSIGSIVQEIRIIVFNINPDGTLSYIGSDSIQIKGDYEDPIDLDVIPSSVPTPSETSIYILLLASIDAGGRVYLYNMTASISLNQGLNSLTYTRNIIVSGDEVYDMAVTKIGTTYYEGVLARIGYTLQLQLYRVDGDGSIASVSNVSIISSKITSDLESAIANYTNGFLVAAGGDLYYYKYLDKIGWVFIDSTDSTSLTPVAYVADSYDGEAYGIIVATGSNSGAAYIFSNNNTGVEYDILVTAIDLVAKGRAYTDTVYYSGKVLRYSDPIVAWVDGATGDIVREGTEGARPYYIYTATGAGPGTQSSPSYAPSAVGSSGSGITYYDLTQGGSVPYPVPEPWYVGLAVLAIALVAVMYYGRRQSMSPGGSTPAQSF